MEPERAQAIVFDKDGTLVDFHATWAPAVRAAFVDVFVDADAATAAAHAIGFDLATSAFHTDSVAIHCSNAQLRALIDPHGDGHRFIDRLAIHVLDHVRAADHAHDVVATLLDAGVPLAVATNDDEQTARQQLDRLGWSQAFVYVVGSDSGHGAKPSPGIVTAAVGALGSCSSATLMVGDSAADLRASRSAGTTGVLVGGAADLAPLADVVVEDLRGLLDLVGVTLSPPARRRGG